MVNVPLPVKAIPHYTFQAWLTPPPLTYRTARRDEEKTRSLTGFDRGGVTGFEIGSGPMVLALHGWGGRPAQMAGIARRLADDGFCVIVPDLPCSAGRPATDIKQVAEVVGSLIDELGEPVAIVGHSFASMVMRLVLDEPTPPAVVLIAPALRVTDALQVFGDRLGLLPWARRGLRRRLENWDIELWPIVAGLHPEQFPGAELLILHDPADDDTPFGASAELAALRPGTRLVTVEGSGHSGILNDPRSLDEVSRFVSGVSAIRPAP